MSVGPGTFVSLTPPQFTQEAVSTQARACCVIDGIVYPLKSYSIQKNAHGATNTASITLPFAGMPDWTRQIFRDVATQGQDYGSSPVYVEIWAGFPPNPGLAPSTSGLQRRFYGVVDQYDPEDMDKTTFKLRSIAAPLTTDRITTAVQNLTTVQFIKQIAAPYNIPVFIDPTLSNPMTLAKVYAQEFVVGLKNLVKWDVMLRGSVFDDTDIWEDDGTLYYVQPWNVVKYVPAAALVQLEYGRNVKSFKPSHAPQFARNIRVQVHSYAARSRLSTATRVESLVGGIAVSQVNKLSIASPQWGTNGGTTTVFNDNGSVTHSTWSSSGGSASGSTTPISESGQENYDFYFPGLSIRECQNLAMTIWRQISQHEYQGEIELAVTPDLLPNLKIESRFDLRGYPMRFFNTEYWPRTLDESFEMAEPGSADGGGWTVRMHCANHALPLGGV